MHDAHLALNRLKRERPVRLEHRHKPNAVGAPETWVDGWEVDSLRLRGRRRGRYGARDRLAGSVHGVGRLDSR